MHTTHTCSLNNPLQDLELPDYARLVCALLNIPVHGDERLLESLHLAFSLLRELRAHPFFVGALAAEHSLNVSPTVAV